jgi:hypothetical protein
MRTSLYSCCLFFRTSVKIVLNGQKHATRYYGGDMTLAPVRPSGFLAALFNSES